MESPNLPLQHYHVVFHDIMGYADADCKEKSMVILFTLEFIYKSL